ncbi:MAG: hypothetical protein KGI38_11495 [Thaumarchaeota archaeon]|nr:hypothetical protein [Nitrososphaerota archaeon]
MSSGYILQIERDLRVKDTDDKALTRLIRIRRDLARMKGSKLAREPLAIKLEELTKGIPESVSCDCCGFSRLINIKRKDGYVIGPECSNHDLGTCKGKGSRP